MVAMMHGAAVAEPRSYQEYLEAMKRHSHAGEVGQALQLLRQLERQGLEPTVEIMNAVLHACTQAADLAHAEAMFGKMLERGLEPTVVTYNAIINCCAAQGEPARAEDWLERMTEANVDPTDVTYGTICKAYARSGNVEAVEKIMAALDETEHPLNEYFFAALISACGAVQPPDTARAEAAVAEMARRGLRLQAVSRALKDAVGGARAADLLSGDSDATCARSRRRQR